ncbi:hypothetical protein [Moraxella lacunata]|uniref:hypothetical protein n=1 Tax=Moraxella lacunata TaxID=477 RepID=UPI003EE38745
MLTLTAFGTSIGVAKFGGRHGVGRLAMGALSLVAHVFVKSNLDKGWMMIFISSTSYTLFFFMLLNCYEFDNFNPLSCA